VCFGRRRQYGGDGVSLLAKQGKSKKAKGKMNTETKITDIRQRSFAFAVRIVKLCRFLEKNPEVSNALVRQLIRSGTSIGANLEEAQSGQSKPDFVSKNAILSKKRVKQITGCV
jgi:hypothetical protein